MRSGGRVAGQRAERTRVSRTTSRPGFTITAQPRRPVPPAHAVAADRQRDARAPPHPTTKVGTLPPPALTLMTELREARVTARPRPRRPTKNGFTFDLERRQPDLAACLLEEREHLLRMWTPLLHDPGVAQPLLTAAAQASGAVSSPTST